MEEHEGVHFKPSSSKRNEDDSNSWADPEELSVAQTDGSAEGALLDTQLVSPKGKNPLLCLQTSKELQFTN